MTVLNKLDRYHLAGDVVDRVARLRNVGAHFKQLLRDKLVEHNQYVRRARRRYAGSKELDLAVLSE